MKDVMIQLIMAFFGSLGLAVLYQLRRALWIPASVGGILCWGSYLLAYAITGHIFVSGLTASICAAVYSEILATIRKAPATLFMIPSVVPLMPGSSLYYTMSAAVMGNTEEASRYGSLTVQYALAIAGGISVVWTFCFLFRRYCRLRQEHS